MHNLSDLVRHVLFVALPPHNRWIKYFMMGVWPRVTAAGPQNHAVDQIPQFAVGNSHFL